MQIKRTGGLFPIQKNKKGLKCVMHDIIITYYLLECKFNFFVNGF